MLGKNVNTERDKRELISDCETDKWNQRVEAQKRETGLFVLTKAAATVSSRSPALI